MLSKFDFAIPIYVQKAELNNNRKAILFGDQHEPNINDHVLAEQIANIAKEYDASMVIEGKEADYLEECFIQQIDLKSTQKSLKRSYFQTPAYDEHMYRCLYDPEISIDDFSEYLNDEERFHVSHTDYSIEKFEEYVQNNGLNSENPIIASGRTRLMQTLQSSKYKDKSYQDMLLDFKKAYSSEKPYEFCSIIDRFFVQLEATLTIDRLGKDKLIFVFIGANHIFLNDMFGNYIRQNSTQIETIFGDLTEILDLSKIDYKSVPTFSASDLPKLSIVLSRCHNQHYGDLESDAETPTKRPKF